MSHYFNHPCVRLWVIACVKFSSVCPCISQLIWGFEHIAEFERHFLGHLIVLIYFKHAIHGIIYFKALILNSFNKSDVTSTVSHHFVCILFWILKGGCMWWMLRRRSAVIERPVPYCANNSADINCCFCFGQIRWSYGLICLSQNDSFNFLLVFKHG